MDDIRVILDSHAVTLDKHRHDIDSLRQHVGSLDLRMTAANDLLLSVRSELSGLKSEMSGLKTDVAKSRELSQATLDALTMHTVQEAGQYQRQTQSFERLYQIIARWAWASIVIAVSLGALLGKFAPEFLATLFGG